MDPRRVIAVRIDMGLRRHLGEGVDTERTLRDARYARDVLLVCDALAGTDLPALARQFRAAGRAEGPPQEWSADTSGFGLSAPLPAADDAAPRKPWYSPRRWFS